MTKRKSVKASKPCAIENCTRTAVAEEKYCFHCKIAVLHELKRTGYLTKTKTSNAQQTEQRGRSARNLQGGLDMRATGEEVEKD